MTDFEKKLREVAPKDLGLAIGLLVHEFYEGQNVFYGKSEEGVTVFVHSKDNEADLVDVMNQADDILQSGMQVYEETKEEFVDLQ